MPAVGTRRTGPSAGKVIAVIVAVFLGFALFIGGCTAWLVVSKTKPYFDTANTYLAHLRDGELSAARSLKCPGARTSVTDDLETLRELRWRGQYDLNAFSSRSQLGLTTRYEVSGRLGSGRAVTVYLARSADCVQELRPRSVWDPNEGAGEPASF